ncbi:MAG: 3-phosphoshikimate 1-carboxyvinyltransferase [Muribaculaceae bacterium]|nr:3-phosphoshikimate 1-carboxyvinyltransferase [Muribaculaceae bacterium]
MNLRINPPEEMIDVAIELPLSKSISNRALIMDALSAAPVPCRAVADCDDTAAVRAALSLLGEMPKGATVNVGMAGTAMRFLTAYVAATPGLEAELDGDERMRERPIGPLVDVLRRCGAEIEYSGREGYPPLRVKGRQLSGGEMNIDAAVSSQFVSALLMVAPTFSSPLSLRLQGEISSFPYIKMTVGMMERRGINCEIYGSVITVEPGKYLSDNEPIERDWSAASYWYEIAAISAGWVTLPGLRLPSLQGDAAAARFFERLGIVSGTENDEGETIDGMVLTPSPEVHSRLDLDLSDNPDLAQALAVTCCMVGVPFHFTGLASLKIKETDRLQALQSELAKLSYAVEIIRGSELAWQMQRCHVEELQPIDTHGDHRMAMAMAPAALFVSGLIIRHAEVVTKSYPEYWDHLRMAGFQIEEV